MNLMPEQLARAHMEVRLAEAERERLARRVLAARKADERAEAARRHAHRALARALAH